MDVDRGTSGSPPTSAGAGQSVRVSRSWAASFGLLIALIAAAGVAWLYWTLIWRADEAKPAEEAALAVRMAKVADDVTAQIDHELGPELQTLRDQGRSVEQRLEAVEAAVANLLTESGREVPASLDDWNVAEAGYLLRMAGNTLQIERDAGAALELLREADAQLAQIAGIRFQRVRESIAADIVLLEAMGATADAREVYLAIEELQNALGDVLAASGQHPDAIPVSGAEQPTRESTGFSWDSVRESLADLVRIRRVADEVMRAPPDAIEITLLEQRIRLSLQQAQLAVLRREPEALAASLRTVRELVTKMPASAATARFFEALAALESLHMAGELPDLRGTLETFEAAVQSTVVSTPLPISESNRAASGIAGSEASGQSETDASAATGGPNP